jgi:hypothetical protein
LIIGSGWPSPWREKVATQAVVAARGRKIEDGPTHNRFELKEVVIFPATP